jgi:UDP-glucose 4-epimerase
MGFDTFNVSTSDFVTVNEIADLVIRELDLDPKDVEKIYSGGDRGWKADVPIVRLDSTKISKHGWAPRFTSHQAMLRSIEEMSEKKNKSAPKL